MSSDSLDYIKNIAEFMIEIEAAPGCQVLIAKDQDDLKEKISRLKPTDMSLEVYKKGTLAGTVDECKECLKVYVNLDVTYFMLYFADLPSIDGLRLFSENVAKKM
jgi:hypothetical protein